jgi:transposase
MAQERGYSGSASNLRREVAKLRPRRVPEPFLRLARLPGEEAQVDWGNFGCVQVGKAKRKLYAFVMSLAWSRGLWLQFFFDMQMSNFLQGHVCGFAYFGGVTRKTLYDNLKSAVIERDGNAIRFNPRLLELANHYGFEPRAAAPGRGNEKPMVERSIRYIRESFFAARPFHSLERLNKEALDWCQEIAEQRKWPQDDTRKVCDVMIEERERLRALPADAFPAYERKPVRVGRCPYIRFDLNDYSVPSKHVRSTVEVLADHKKVRIVSEGQVVATHDRSFDRHADIQDPRHTEEILEFKRQARRPSGGHRLHAAAPSSELFLTRGAERGHNLGSLISRLLSYLDDYGAEPLEKALATVNEKDGVNLKAVLQLLSQGARAAQQKPRLPVKLPREELGDIYVRKPSLASYDPSDTPEPNLTLEKLKEIF